MFLMHKKALPSLSFIALMFATAIVVCAQGETPAKPAATGSTPVAITASSTPVDLARAALAAHGGDKFKNIKSQVLTGTVNFYAPNVPQPIPGKFSMTTMGDKARFDMDASPMMVFTQIYDGKKLYSSSPAVPLPPPDKFGLNVLGKYDQSGYTVTALPDDKKLRGFTIADAQGNSTKFYIDAASGRVLRYVFDFGGYTFENENKKFKDVEGVLGLAAFTVKIETPQGAFLAEYSVKDIKLNPTLADTVFNIPN